MGAPSSDELLVLHAVRIQGMADPAAVARRFSLAPAVVESLLLDYEALGWVRRAEFADLAGWTLTGAGRAENVRRLGVELDEAGARPTVSAGYAGFLQLNGRLLKAVTDWQIRPTSWEPMARNDHSDFRWDDRVLDSLAGLDRGLRPVCSGLTDALDRFGGYADRFSAAVARVNRGERSWVDQVGIDSCHTVWFQLHEDLLATLDIDRGQEPGSAPEPPGQ